MVYVGAAGTAGVAEPLAGATGAPIGVSGSSYETSAQDHDRRYHWDAAQQRLPDRAGRWPRVVKAIADAGCHTAPVLGVLLAIGGPIILAPDDTVLERVGLGFAGVMLTCAITVVFLAVSVRQALTIARSQMTAARDQQDAATEAHSNSSPSGWSTYTVGVRVDAVDSVEKVTSRIRSAVVQRRSCLMTFANPATSVLAARDPAFREVLAQFDLVAPDGIGMVVAMQTLHRRPATRISFDSTSLAPFVFRLAAEQGVGVVLVGGAPGVAEAAKRRLIAAYPGVDICRTFDGYSNADMTIEAIIALAPGIVIIGMGAPLQETFLLKLSNNGWVGLGFTCGGFLDQLAVKGVAYYPAWVDRYNVRSVFRLIKEPHRLGRRYLLDYPKFGLLFGGALIRDMAATAIRAILPTT